MRLFEKPKAVDGNGVSLKTNKKSGTIIMVENEGIRTTATTITSASNCKVLGKRVRIRNIIRFMLFFLENSSMLHALFSSTTELYYERTFDSDRMQIRYRFDRIE